MDPSTSGVRRQSKRNTRAPTTINVLSHDILCRIFSLLNLAELVRCSATCKSWSAVIDKLKLLQIKYYKQQQNGAKGGCDMSSSSEIPLSKHLEQLAMDVHKSSLQEGPIEIHQWKGHSVRIGQCRMKMGLILTGIGDKVMRLWSTESYKCLDEYFLPYKAPLIDFDFDESKVVGLVGTRVCIWQRNGKRNIFSSRENLFANGLCMRYVDPEAMIGCQDGKVRIFDMYSRRCSKIIKMQDGPVTCLTLSEDQLITSGSSLGSISVLDLSSDQRVATLTSTQFTGIKTLCRNERSNFLFAGSTAGHASCWDLRTMRRLWETRVSPNVLYSMHHLRNDTSTLVVGGIDGVLRFVDQNTGEVLSQCIIDESNSRSKNDRYENGGRSGVIVRRVRARRIPEDARIDLMNKASRPTITCLAVGMQKVVTTHNDKYVRAWKFKK